MLTNRQYGSANHARRYLFAILLLAAFAFPRLAGAGAWTQSPTQLYGRLTYAWLDSRTRFDAQGNRIGLEEPGQPARDTEYRDREVRAYIEYGVAERLTAYGSFAYKRLQLVEPTLFLPGRVIPEAIHRTSGVGDFYLGGRVGVVRGSRPLSVATEIKIPTGYSARTYPSLGTGKADATIRMLLGASAGWVYATLDAGWSYRGGSYQNELLYSFELGGRILQRYYSWRGVVRGVRSLGEPPTRLGAAAFDPNLASPRAHTFDVIIGAQVLPSLDLEAGMSHVLSGHNSLAGTTFEIGMAWSPRMRRGS